MNSAEMEICRAVGAVRGDWVVRSLCLFCGECLGELDAGAVCSPCMEVFFPVPRVEVAPSGPRKASLFRLSDGRYAILLD